MFTDDDFIDYEEGEDIPTSKVDEALIKYRKLEDEYAAITATRKEKYAELNQAKLEFISMLKALKKDRWEVEGHTGFTIYEQLNYRVPDSPESKRMFFEFLKSDKVSKMLQQDSQDIYDTYVTVNSNKLNSLCRSLVKQAAENGDLLEIPGLMPPKHETKMRSLPRRKK